MADLYYIDDDYYTPSGYFTYTADAVSACATTTSVDCVAVKTVNAVIQQVSLFSPNFTVNVTSSASTDLTVVSTLSASVDKTKGTNVTLSTIVSLSLQADKIKGTSIGLNSVASISTVVTEYESYIASSPTPFYALGQALINTTQTHFGSHSLNLPDADAGAITASTHTKFNIPTTDSGTQSVGEQGRFAIAFWFYPTSSPGTGYDDIVSFWDPSINEGWRVRFGNTRRISFTIVGTTSETNESSSLGLNDLNAWNYVVITRTWDSTNRGTLKISVNGTESVSDTSHDHSTGTAARYLRIGNLQSGSFTGYIDGLRIIIGDTISTTTVPTEDTVYGTANTKLLMNWNGTWFDDSGSQLVTADAALSSQFTQSSTVSRQRLASATVLASCSLSITATVVTVASASTSTDFTVTAQSERLRFGQSNLTSEFTVSALAQDLDLAQATLNSNFSITATPGIIKSAASAQSTTATQFTTARRLRSTGIALTCQGFLVAVGLDLDLAEANLACQVTMVTTAVKTTSTGANFSSTATESATVLRIKSTEATLSSIATVACFETRLKDVFVSGILGQVYFRNTVDSPNYVADTGDKFISVSGGSSNLTTSNYAIAFWASGEGYVWSGAANDAANNYDNYILLTGNDFVFRYYNGVVGESVTLTWSGIDTLVNNHYLLYGNKLWVNGVDQGSPTVAGSATPKLYGGLERLLGIKVERLGFGGNQVLASPGGYKGTLGQYVMWPGETFGGSPVPNFALSSERQKIYNAGYVDIGTDGTLSGLNRPYDYVRLSDYQDLALRGNAVFSGSASWRQLGTTVIISGTTYYNNLNYTATEADDAGPFISRATLSITAQTVLIITANLASNFALTPSVTKLVGTVQNLNSEFALSASLDRVRLTQANLAVTGSELVIAVKTGRTLVTIESQATLSASTRYDAQGSANLTSTMTMVCTARKTVSAVTALTVSSALASESVRTRRFDSAINSALSLSVQARKTVGITAPLQTTATVLASAFNTYSAQAPLQATATVNGTAIVQFIAASDLVSSTSMVCNNNKIVGFRADLQAFDFMLAIGTKITLDPYYQLRVESETRIKKITQESGILTVDSENRVNTVQAEHNILIVPRETRVWHIPYSPQVGTRRIK